MRASTTRERLERRRVKRCRSSRGRSRRFTRSSSAYAAEHLRRGARVLPGVQVSKGGRRAPVLTALRLDLQRVGVYGSVHFRGGTEFGIDCGIIVQIGN